jgi:hypothetical protein
VLGPEMKNWQLPTVFVFGVVFLAVLLWLVFLHPNLTYDECIVVKVVLSLAAAGIGAIIPGTISANAGGFAKAGGAAAFFRIVFFRYDYPKNEPHPNDVHLPTPTTAQPAPHSPLLRLLKQAFEFDAERIVYDHQPGFLPKQVDFYLPNTNTLNVPGSIGRSGCGLTGVGSGAGPNSAVDT